MIGFAQNYLIESHYKKVLESVLCSLVVFKCLRILTDPRMSKPRLAFSVTNSVLLTIIPWRRMLGQALLVWKFAVCLVTSKTKAHHDRMSENSKVDRNQILGFASKSLEQRELDEVAGYCRVYASAVTPLSMICRNLHTILLLR